MSWAGRRQFTYFSGFSLFVAIVLFFILYPIFHKAPTCFDNKQNQNETGIDCGGVCDLMCKTDVSDPVVLWSRVFPVSNGVYNLLAYVENQNKNSAIKKVSYEFRVYDTNNTLIGRKEGATYIPPNSRFAIFEPRFDAGQTTPKSVTFEFTSPFIWFKKDPIIQTMPIHIDRIILGEDLKLPTLSAEVVNDSIYDLPAFDAITILYNADHNAISISKTHKEGLKSNSSASLYFTWPKAFLETPAVKDVFLQINPFLTSF
jgi:hypothetical protein